VVAAKVGRRPSSGRWLPYPLAVPSKEKPYRVYRAGRARGRIKPLPPLRPEEPLASGDGLGPPPLPPELEPREQPPPPKPRRRRIALWVGLVLVAFLLLIVAWGLAGYFSLRGGVSEANDRLPARALEALTPGDGSLLSSPGTTLLIGTDEGPGREGARADAIVLVRTDPDEHRISLLSIPRDLRVEIPGYGMNKVNAAYSFGGAALTIDTVEALTGVPVNHVAVVDFASFGELIDALGGVTIDVPKPILSNRFDCPYSSKARCDRWDGWQFKAGEQTMDGRRALIYSRIRENQLDPSESDLTRGGRQQQVVQAITGEISGISGFFRMPFIGKDVMRPLATDLSTNEIIQLGWVEFRSSSTLRCRLGGVPDEIDGVAYLVGVEENVNVIDMVVGEAAPQPPPKGLGPFAPGCSL
jgi:polyisoprenyl-teichoic acid--peptidoglycan teichoic acid transferase